MPKALIWLKAKPMTTIPLLNPSATYLSISCAKEGYMREVLVQRLNISASSASISRLNPSYSLDASLATAGCIRPLNFFTQAIAATIKLSNRFPIR